MNFTLKTNEETEAMRKKRDELRDKADKILKDAIKLGKKIEKAEFSYGLYYPLEYVCDNIPNGDYDIESLVVLYENGREERIYADTILCVIKDNDECIIHISDEMYVGEIDLISGKYSHWSHRVETKEPKIIGVKELIFAEEQSFKSSLLKETEWGIKYIKENP